MIQGLSPAIEATQQTAPPLRARLFAVLTPVVAALSAFLVTNNWCFVLIPAAGIALFTDLVFGAKLSGRIRLLLVCAIGAATGLLLRVSPDWAFREALRTPQPPSARIALISRHYSGGPGEHVMIVEFEADWRDMLEILDSHGGTPLEEQDAALYERVRTDGGDWHKLFEALVPANVSMLARFHWQRIASITRPEIWVQRGDGMTWTYVIRDPTSRRVVLLCRCA